MGRSRKKRRARRTIPVTEPAKIPPGSAQAIDTESYNRFDFVVMALLLAFGVYLSITFYGHLTVPNSDFPDFVQTGESILSFKLPGSFKRLPVFGTMVAAFGHVVGGQHPNLTAGWLLNCILFSLNGVLLYLVGRKILGRAAAFYVLIAVLNPWTIAQLVDPILEITLIFFMLLTFYLLSVNSRWCYLVAAITAMTRYEGAALILTVFLVDIVAGKSRKDRLLSLLYAALASLPLIVWLVIWKSGPAAGGRGYGSHFTGAKHIGLGYFKLLWETGFGPLLQLPSWVVAFFVHRPDQAAAAGIANSVEVLSVVSMIVVSVGFLTTAGWAVVKRHRHTLSLLLFWFCYVSVHSMRHLSMNRYCVPVAWLTLLVAFRGMQILWGWIGNERFVGKAVSLGAQIFLLVVAGIWFFRLVVYVPRTSLISSDFTTVPYAAAAMVCLIFAMMYYMNRDRRILRNLAVAILMCLLLVSNQFVLAMTVGDGRRDVEFKELADWYVENAKPGEKLVTTMPQVMRIYAPKHAGRFVRTESIAGDDRRGFVEGCYKKNITYIAWDSRLGLARGDSYYRRYGLIRIAALQSGRDTGPYRFLTTLTASRNRYIHIYRLEKNPPAQNRPR
ncbi:MAG: hypothetical protein J7M40_06970 [Planctomycetes bacterium]|nr:hypothetical protein [Planctomycetota bacterium]